MVRLLNPKKLVNIIYIYSIYLVYKVVEYLELKNTKREYAAPMLINSENLPDLKKRL